MKKLKWKELLVLHLILMIYSISDVCSKLAARQQFLSKKFCIYYAAVLGLLALYALLWQQVIKRMPLIMAFANKAVTVLWGLLWGVICFHEQVTAAKVAGILLVMAGVVIYATADGEYENGTGSD